MREILFRGKRTDNGEWVYGNYCKAEYIGGGGYEYFIIEIGEDGGQFRIDPETVGQKTGVTDRNGATIFEGDIVKVSNFRLINDKSGGERAFNPFNLVIIFYHGTFLCSTDNDIKTQFGIHLFDYINKYDTKSPQEIGEDGFEVEVIGNVYDNSNLIEDGTPLANRYWGVAN